VGGGGGWVGGGVGCVGGGGGEQAADVENRMRPRRGRRQLGSRQVALEGGGVHRGAGGRGFCVATNSGETSNV